jgi:hypothetical protein
MSLDDIKHKKCAVCDKRLDRVKYWNNVQKDELILKLDKLREGVENLIVFVAHVLIVLVV